MFYSVEQLRQTEANAAAAGYSLMPVAGRAAADFVCTRFPASCKVTVLVGPGNNGGDGLIAATLLRDRGFDVSVVMPADPTALPCPANAAYAGWKKSDGIEARTLPDYAPDLYIDALFGIGLNRQLGGEWQALIATVNQAGKPVLALDVPSGVHADCGEVIGEAIRATWTLSFIGKARGLATGAALDHVGELHFNQLDLPCTLLPYTNLTDTDEVCKHVRIKRPIDSNKGRFGSVLVIGGAAGMVGAALLAGRAALHSGAGKVLIALLDADGPSVDFVQPELMLHRAKADQFIAADILLIGPGLGQSDAAISLLEVALKMTKPLVADADALNLIAKHPHLQQLVIERPHCTVLTPHPGEAARLLQTTPEVVQSQRFVAAQKLSDRYHSIVVLKGAGTVIAAKEMTSINQTGSAALANAGQGDVLGGAIAALLAQGLSGWQAVNLASLAHGMTSDALIKSSGVLCTPASCIATSIGQTLGRWRS